MTRRFHATDIEIAAAQRDFDFLIPYQHRGLLTPPEVAGIFRRSAEFARQLVQEGKLEAHLDTARGQRLSNRITRRSVCVHLARTANYVSQDHLRSLIETARTLPSNFRAELVLALLSVCEESDLVRIITRAQSITSNRSSP